jgi:hypothetical protein
MWNTRLPSRWNAKSHPSPPDLDSTTSLGGGEIGRRWNPEMFAQRRRAALSGYFLVVSLKLTTGGGLYGGRAAGLLSVTLELSFLSQIHTEELWKIRDRKLRVLRNRSGVDSFDLMAPPSNRTPTLRVTQCLRTRKPRFKTS